MSKPHTFGTTGSGWGKRTIWLRALARGRLPSVVTVGDNPVTAN
jgi:hypothetical protein